MIKTRKILYSLSRIFISIFILLSLTSSLFADVWVDGYYRKDGTYVRGHYRSDPDGDFYNNWSTKGNVNPYTGEVGTKTKPGGNSYYESQDSSIDYSYSNNEYPYSYSSGSDSSDNSWLWGVGIMGGILFLSSKKDHS